jgi:hypothetical protein
MVTFDVQDVRLKHVFLHTALCRLLIVHLLEAQFGLVTLPCIADGSVPDVSCVNFAYAVVLRSLVSTILN